MSVESAPVRHGCVLLRRLRAQVCSGFGDPDLDRVACDCLPVSAPTYAARVSEQGADPTPFRQAYYGDAVCSSCTTGSAYGEFPYCSMCAAYQGSPCGTITGRGTCDPLLGCVCNLPFADPTTGCASCADGYWGPSCAPCPDCGSHGSCDGSGTPGGTGVCVCTAGWSGATCSGCLVGFYGPLCSSCPDCGDHGSCEGSGSHSGTGACVCSGGWSGRVCNSPPAAQGAPAPVNGGAIAAGVIVGLLVLGAAGVGMWARWGGGSPTLRAAATRLQSFCSWGGGGASERVAILAAPRAAAAPVTAAAAKARFGALLGGEPVAASASGGYSAVGPSDS